MYIRIETGINSIYFSCLFVFNSYLQQSVLVGDKIKRKVILLEKVTIPPTRQPRRIANTTTSFAVVSNTPQSEKKKQSQSLSLNVDIEVFFRFHYYKTILQHLMRKNVFFRPARRLIALVSSLGRR